MSLTSIQLKNFKCFLDSGDIRIAPLTVIFGRNNAGKSTILQSLLLLRQTFDAPEYGQRLVLNGTSCHLGSFADLVHDHRASSSISLKFGLAGGNGVPPGFVEFEFRSDEPQPPILKRMEVWRNQKRAFNLKIQRGKGQGGPYEIIIDDKRLGGEPEAGFAFVPGRYLPFLDFSLHRRGHAESRNKSVRLSADQMLELFEDTIRNFRAVGAFRQQPERRYEYQGPAPSLIGAAGEYVMAALIEDALHRRKRGVLLNSVNRWLNMLGQVRLMPIRRISKSARLFELRVKEVASGKWANYADVGFGIGQALPIIVEGLRTPRGALFLVQEPEIHLHPDAQLAMADFLIDLAHDGGYVVAETHSENILLRIRHRIARRRSILRPREVSIVIVHRHSDGKSEAKPLTIDDLGQVQEWPRGFMQEATEERMAILSTMADK